MRPITIELEGFGAFRDRTVVDLADADLFAIVGATGHGKSTLIDAICFALYGKVPRYPEGQVAPTVSLGSNQARVALEFELGGARYLATRIVRLDEKRAAKQTVRLEAVDGDVLAGSVKEFKAEVARLVGLDFEQFTKCVVLPQGRFAEFLHAPAGERTSILSALLDLGRYDRMAAVARERAKTAAAQRGVLERSRDEIGDVTPELVVELRARHALLVEVQAEVTAAQAADDELAAKTRDVQARADAARRGIDALGRVFVPPEVRELAATAQSADDQLIAASEAAAAAETRATQLESARDELPDLVALQALRGLYDEQASIAQRIANGVGVLESRSTAARQADDAVVTAQAAVDDALAALSLVQQSHAHATLRNALVMGEPCPVCEQIVEAKPKPLSTAAIDKARTTLDGAQAKVKKAETAAANTRREFHQAEALLTQLRERAAELTAQLEGAPSRTELDDESIRVEALIAEAAAARRSASAARTTEQEAAAAVAALSDARQHAERVFGEQRDAVVSAGLEPPQGTGSLAERWAALAAWAVDVRPDHEKALAAAEDDVRRHRAEREALIGDLAARAEIGDAASLPTLATAVVAAARDAHNDAERAQEKLARAAQLGAEIALVRDTEVVAAELGLLLDKRHFGQWLVDEALDGLVSGASEILERLSAGQYALVAAADGELLVVDHVNADETRSVRSLSGGETFQASLALALALADRITELAAAGAAALESIFLDEGFGTLDPETLDVVAGTIESLGHGDRVVGVVTHVPELAERMPTRLRVRKQGRTAVVVREDT